MTIPIDFMFFIVPAILVWLWSLRFSSQRTGGVYFPPSSEREAFWFFGIPLYLIVSFASWGIYLRIFE